MTQTSLFDSFTARLREFILGSTPRLLGAPASSPARLGALASSPAISAKGIRAGEDAGAPSDAGAPGASSFDRLALELFALQFEHNAPYRRFAEAQDRSPRTVGHWSQIPAVPTAAFKELELSCLPVAERTAVFHSSGTTGQRPSRHFHSAESLAIYETSLLAWFVAQCPRLDPSGRLVTTPGSAIQLAILTPPLAQAPHSSLVHMFETIRRGFGTAESAFYGRLREDGSWRLDLACALEALRGAAARERPVMTLGTAFAWVQLLDHMTEHELQFELPPGSRALETGGYKGRSRSLAKAELHSLITSRLGLPLNHIVGEYGMNELSSQAYEHAVSEASGITRRFHFPPWARAQIISPETGREVGEGETGLIRVFDLANVYSVLAIQTEDLGIRRGDGFELIGRAAVAEPRGCSLMAG